MENQQIGWANTAFTDQVKVGQDAEDIADTIVSAWGNISVVFQSVIGRQGITALFHRTIEVSALSYPWLAEAIKEAAPSIDLERLRSVLLKQDMIHFAEASDSMLQQFYGILTELIGLSLTERLLRPVLDPLLK